MELVGAVPAGEWSLVRKYVNDDDQDDDEDQDDD